MECYNFKNADCQEIFHQKTNEKRKLSQCFLEVGHIEKQAGNWFKVLKGICHQSFQKIRHTTKKKETEISLLLEKKRTCIQKLNLEEQVSDLVAEENRNKVMGKLQKFI